MQNLEQLLRSFGFIVKDAHTSEVGRQKNIFIQAQLPKQAPGSLLEFKGWAHNLLEPHGWDVVDAARSKIFLDVYAMQLKANSKKAVQW